MSNINFLELVWLVSVYTYTGPMSLYNPSLYNPVHKTHSLTTSLYNPVHKTHSLTTLQTSFLNVVFVTGLGMIMYNSGVNYRYLDSIGAADLIPDSSKLEFAGSIIATASWVSL